MLLLQFFKENIFVILFYFFPARFLRARVQPSELTFCRARRAVECRHQSKDRMVQRAKGEGAAPAHHSVHHRGREENQSFHEGD